MIVNKKLLKQILSIQCDGKDYTDVITFIKNYINELKDTSIQTQKDSYGNLYITKGTSDNYPCIVAHMDTVHTNVPDYEVFEKGNILFAFSGNGSQVGIGGDDKCGIYVALHALKFIKNLKLVFYMDEEVGKLGSKHSIKNIKSWYEDCSYILQCDRKGNSDFISQSAGIYLYSEEFLNAVKPLLTQYKFKETVGISTDVDALVSGDVGVSCVNISSGYYSPHSNREYVNVKDVNTSLSLVLSIINLLKTTRYEHIHTPKVYSYSENYRSWYSRSSSPLTKKGILFKRMDRTNIYHDYIGKETLIPVMGKYYFLADDNRFFNLKTQEFVTRDGIIGGLLHRMSLTENDIKYVFSKYLDSWLNTTNKKVYWDDTDRDYLVKDA